MALVIDCFIFFIFLFFNFITSLKYQHGIFFRGPIWYFSEHVNTILLFYLMNKMFPLCFCCSCGNTVGKFQACGFLISSHGRAVSGEIELQDNVYSNDDYIETASLLEQVDCNISSLIFFSLVSKVRILLLVF